MHRPRRLSAASLVALSALVVGAFALFSCEVSTTEAASAPPEPRTLSGTLSVKDSTRPPDSATWLLGVVRGRLDLKCSGYSCAFSGKVGSANPGDSVWLEIWDMGVRSGRVLAMNKADGVFEFVSTQLVSDSVTTRLRANLDSLHRVDPILFSWNADGLLNAMAQALAVNDRRILPGYPASRPVGMDTTGMVLRSLKLAILRQGSLAQIATDWGIPLTLDQATPLVAGILAQKQNHVDDSIRLFPPASLRIANFLTFSGPLWPGANAVKVQGKIVGDSGLVGATIAVMRGTDTTRGMFDFRRDVALSATVWTLDSLTLRALASCPPGGYTLVVRASDRKGSAIVVKVPFDVAPTPDVTGPAISFLSPEQDSILDAKDSVMSFVATATDASGIDSILLYPSRDDSLHVWDATSIRSGDTVRVRNVLMASGRTRKIHVRAWDKAGNVSDSVRIVTRPTRAGSIEPSLDRLHPEAIETVLPVDSLVLHLVYSATSFYGIPDSGVVIDGVRATKDSASTWSLDLPVVATGDRRYIRVTVVDKLGQKKEEILTVVRVKDTAGPLIRRVSPASRDTVVNHSAVAGLVRVLISDPSGVGQVLVGGVPADSLGSGSYLGVAPLNDTVDTSLVHVVARDSRGNVTDSVFRFVRGSKIVGFYADLVSPKGHTGNVVADTATSTVVSWRISSSAGVLDTSVRVTGEGWTPVKGVRRKSDPAIYDFQIPLPFQGVNQAISLSAKDGAGRTLSDKIWVLRPDAPTRKTLHLGFDGTWSISKLRMDSLGGTDSIATLSWKHDDCPKCRFYIDTVVADSALGHHGSKVPLPLGISSYRIVVFDSASRFLDSSRVWIHRYPVARILKISSVDTVGPETPTLDAVWKVSGARSIRIGGDSVAVTDSSLYRRTIVFSKVVSSGDQRVGAVLVEVVDSAGGVARLTNAFVQTYYADLALVARNPDSAVQWDNACFTASTAVDGTTISKLDGSTWSVVTTQANSPQVICISEDGRVHLKAEKTGRLAKFDSSRFVQIRHTNTAPGFKFLDIVASHPEWGAKSRRMVVSEDTADLVRVNLIGNRTMGASKWDALQGFHYEMSVEKPELFAVGPSIGDAGVFSFQVARDRFGVSKIWITLRDDGGVENRGVDTARDSFTIEIAPVNDSPVFDSASVSRTVFIGKTTTLVAPSLRHGGIGEESQVTRYAIVQSDADAKAVSDSAIRVAPVKSGALALKVAAIDSVKGSVDTARSKLPATINLTVVDTVSDVQSGAIHHAVVFGSKLWLLENVGATSVDSIGKRFTSSDTAQFAAGVCPASWRVADSSSWIPSIAVDQSPLKLQPGDYWVRSTLGYQIIKVDPKGLILSAATVASSAAVRCIQDR